MTDPKVPTKGNKEPFKCKGCPPDNPSKLQRVQYGHFQDGKFIVDFETKVACCYCHTVYEEA